MTPERQADVEHWGLTWREQIEYFGRISAYWGRKSAEHGALAVHSARLAARWAAAQVGVMALLVLLLVGKLAGWWT